MALLAIDFGTTNCKAGLFEATGRQLAVASRPTPSHQDEWGTVWYPDEIWAEVAALIRQVMAEANGGAGHEESALPGGEVEVEAISISSVGESGVLLDKEGEALGPVIAWYDLRTLSELAFWTDHVGEEHLRRLTGLPLDPIYSILKLTWLRRHAPEMVTAGRRYLLMADWLAFKLCGEQVTDLSLASRTMALDLAHRRWSDDLLDLAGLPHDIFAPLVPSGTPIGGLLAEVALTLGLRAGTPIVAGGHDHIVASLGAGLVAPGRLLNSTGTAETVLAVVGGEVANLAAPGVTLGCHVVPDTYYALATMRASGASTEWARRVFAGSEHGYEAFLRLVAQGRAAETGLFFLPLLRGSLVPENRPAATGAFVGLLDTHTPADLARAVLEGVCLEAAYMIAYLSELTGLPLERVIAVGGATKNPLWMQLKADTCGVPVEVPAVGEAALRGAALLAGIGIGLYRNAAEAVAQTAGTASTYTPAPDQAAFWAACRDRYAAARAGLLAL